MALFRCASGGGGTTITETTLWTNSSPNATFAAQTIELSQDIGDFDYIKVEYKDAYSVDNTKDFYIKVSDWMTPYTGVTNKTFGIYMTTGSAAYCRQFIYASETSISVTTTFRLNSQANSANVVIPVYVKGVNVS